MAHERRRLWCGAVIAALLLVPVAAARADDDGDRLRSLSEKIAPSICTVKVVLKFTVQGQEGPPETNAELQAVVVDGNGLIMTASAPLVGREIDFMGQKIPLDITPSGFKVVFENEDKEYPAFLATQDSDLGLAFIQIENLEGRTIQAIAFDGESKVAIGDRLALISRLGKGYDYAPYFSTGRVSGQILKPRAAYAIDGTFSAMGLPIFNGSGQVVGALTTVEAASGTEATGNPFDLSSMLNLVRPFVITNKIVQPKIVQAREAAQKEIEERKAHPEGTPKPASGTEEEQPKSDTPAEGDKATEGDKTTEGDSATEGGGEEPKKDG